MDQEIVPRPLAKTDLVEAFALERRLVGLVEEIERAPSVARRYLSFEIDQAKARLTMAVESA